LGHPVHALGVNVDAKTESVKAGVDALKQEKHVQVRLPAMETAKTTPKSR
jgi:hypothetical protein